MTSHFLPWGFHQVGWKLLKRPMSTKVKQQTFSPNPSLQLSMSFLCSEVCRINDRLDMWISFQLQVLIDKLFSSLKDYGTGILNVVLLGSPEGHAVCSQSGKIHRGLAYSGKRRETSSDPPSPVSDQTLLCRHSCYSKWDPTSAQNFFPSFTCYCYLLSQVTEENIDQQVPLPQITQFSVVWKRDFKLHRMVTSLKTEK